MTSQVAMGHKLAKGILAALGLDGRPARRITLELTANDPPVVMVEELLTEEGEKNLIRVFSLSEWREEESR